MIMQMIFWSNELCHSSLLGLFCANIRIDDVHLTSLLGSGVSIIMAGHVAGCVHTTCPL